MPSIFQIASEQGKQALFYGLKQITRSHAIKHYRDISYGELPEQMLDLYLPADTEPTACVIFIHGGSWQFGNRKEYAFVGQSLARQGIATLVVGYRLFPQVKYPEFVCDVARALAWCEVTSSDYGLAELPLYLMGHSAGAHIALLAGLDPIFAGDFGYHRELIRGIICMAGVYSFRPENSALYQQIFPAAACGEQYAQVKPVNFVCRDGIPLYILHGRKDSTVACRSAERMYKNALLAGHPVDLDIRENYGHYAMLFDFLNYGAQQRLTLDRLQQFMRNNP